jgi:hypothetical protein
MRKVYEPIRRQADIARDEYIANQRAWIGPTSVTITNLTTNQPIKADVRYINSGRHPAGADFTVFGRRFQKSDWMSGYGCFALITIKDFCMSREDFVAVSVTWPNTGGGEYNIQYPPISPPDIGEEPITFDAPVQNGDEIAAFVGCFTYRTIEEVHHTAFCYFAQPGDVKVSVPLSICRCGNGAD